VTSLRRVLVVYHEPLPDHVSEIYFPTLDVDEGDFGYGGTPSSRDAAARKIRAGSKGKFLALPLSPDRARHYLKRALARGLLPPINLTEASVVAVIDPADVAAARAFYRRELGPRLAPVSTVFAAYLVPQYSLNLHDVAPLIDAGLLPSDGLSSRYLLTSEGMRFALRDRTNGKLAGSVSVDDILSADLGHLLTPEMDNVLVDVLTEQAAGLCGRASHNWLTGQAYLVTAQPADAEGALERATEEAEDAQAQLHELMKEKSVSAETALAYLEQLVAMMGTTCVNRARDAERNP